MAAKRPRTGRRWSDSRKAEALEVIASNGGDTKASERVLLARHGRAGTPSERQLRRWRDAARGREPATAPQGAPSPREDAEPRTAAQLLQEAAALLQAAQAAALSPADRARVAVALATVSAKLADQEPKAHRELRIRVRAVDLNEEEVQAFLEWIAERRRRAALTAEEDAEDVVASLDRLIAELRVDTGGQLPDS